MIQVPIWGEEPPVISEGGFEDILFAPAQPLPDEEEKTPEQIRSELFHSEADASEHFANTEPGGFHKAGRNPGEVCIMAGWPPRHAQVGRHCPHGLNAPGEEEIHDYT